MFTQRSIFSRSIGNVPARAALFAAMLSLCCAPFGNAASVVWDGLNYSHVDGLTNSTDFNLGQGIYPTDKPLGVYPSNLSPSGNTVTVSTNPAGATVFTGNIYGGVGLTEDGSPQNASDNRVTLGGAVSIVKDPVNANFPDQGLNAGGVYGGLSVVGDASGNTVTIGNDYSGRIAGTVSGGSSGNLFTRLDGRGFYLNGNALNNSVTIDGGTLHGTVHGGDTLHGAARGNSVTLSGGSFSGSIYGGRSIRDGAAENNRVSITGGRFGYFADVYGGYSGTGAVTGNSASLSGSALHGYLYGGYTGAVNATGNVSGNSASASADVGKVVIGGQTAGSGAVFGNSATVHSGVVKGVLGLRQNDAGQVAGKPVSASVVGGFSSGSGNVTGNSAIIRGGEMHKEVIGGFAYAGHAANNTVTVSGGSHRFTANIVGGYAENGGNATGNAVSISGAGTTVKGAVVGGEANKGRAEGNSITITDAYVGGVIAGGVVGGLAPEHSASSNTVTVRGGSIDTGIIGGNALGGQGRTVNNTVNISGPVVFSSAAQIYGGNQSDFTGNTLNTDGFGYNLDSILNFERYTFALSGADNGKIAYTVATPVSLDSTQTHVTFTGKGGPLKNGERVTLFSQSTGEGTYSYDGDHGLLFRHTVAFEKGAASNLDVVITGTEVKKESSLVGQSQLAGLLMVNAASDLIRDVHSLFDAAEIREYGERAPRTARADAGEADNETSDSGMDEPRFAAFAGSRVGASRWNTNGSRIKLDHSSFIAGLGRRGNGFLLAAFFEAGLGTYDTEQDGRRFGKDEDSSYTGGGLLARFEHGGFYAEASGHAGVAKTEVDSLVDGKTRLNYDVRSAYYGADILAGYKFFTQHSSLDVSAKYSWNRYNGDTLRINGADIRLDAVNSRRLRAGGRWTYSGELFRPYIGAHYEYETAGRTASSSHGYALERADLRGGSGIGELGLHIGDIMQRVGLDVGIEGYTGKRKGVAGKIMLGVSF